MLDPIVYRSEVEETSQEETSQEETWNHTESQAQLEPVITSDQDTTWKTYSIQTDNEIVEIKSDILLPSGLKVYNVEDKTHVEYMTASLSPAPEFTEADLQTLQEGNANLFTNLVVVFLFWMFVIFLTNMISWWNKQW